MSHWEEVPVPLPVNLVARKLRLLSDKAGARLRRAETGLHFRRLSATFPGRGTGTSSRTLSFSLLLSFELELGRRNLLKRSRSVVQSNVAEQAAICNLSIARWSRARSPALSAAGACAQIRLEDSRAPPATIYA